MVEILKYIDPAGRSPFDRWFSRLRDPRAQAAVLVRLSRLSIGLTGDSRSLGSGVQELRLHIGPGYRIYYARYGPDGILLLGGGSKATQARDIAAARANLAKHREETKS